MLKGLAETEQTLRGRHIPFQLLSGWPTDTLPEFIAEEQPAAVVCDMSPLRVPMAWVNDVAAKLDAAPGPKVPLCRETARRTCAPTSPPIPCPYTSPSACCQHHEHAHVHQHPSWLRWWTHQASCLLLLFPIADQVDAHNVVPVWVASPKQEVGARTLRKKINDLKPTYLKEFPPPQSNPSGSVKLPAPVDWVRSWDSSLRFPRFRCVSVFLLQRTFPAV